MKMTVLLMIDADKEENVTAQAFSAESANIYITAGNMDRAQALIATGRQKAEAAMENWTPEQEDAPAPADPKCKRYLLLHRAIEDMEEEAAAYEQTTSGRRFKAGIENAREFYYKHNNGYGGLHCEQLNYLANVYHNSLINGSFDLTALAYRHGYKEGQRAAGATK